MPVIDLRRYIVASTGVWTDPAQDHNLFDFTRGDTMSPERLLLRWAGDFVALTGPLRVRVTVQAENMTVPLALVGNLMPEPAAVYHPGSEGAAAPQTWTAAATIKTGAGFNEAAAGHLAQGRALGLQASTIYTYSLDIAAGQAWPFSLSEQLAALRLQNLRASRFEQLGNNLGFRVIIEPAFVVPDCTPVRTSDELPCDFAAADQGNTARFFPTACEPCDGTVVGLPPSDAVALVVPPAEGGCVRTRFFNGMFITREDLETEQRYHRLKSKLHNRASGAGVVWGLAVGKQGSHLCVLPGYAVDCCGNDLTLSTTYKVEIAALVADPLALPFTRKRGPHRMHLLLEYIECPSDARPVHGDPCATDITRCETSRIRETVRLRLIPPRDCVTERGPLKTFLDDVRDLRKRYPLEQAPGIVQDTRAPFQIRVSPNRRAGSTVRPSPDTTSVDLSGGKLSALAIEVIPDAGWTFVGGTLSAEARLEDKGVPGVAQPAGPIDLARAKGGSAGDLKATFTLPTARSARVPNELVFRLTDWQAQTRLAGQNDEVARGDLTFMVMVGTDGSQNRLEASAVRMAAPNVYRSPCAGEPCAPRRRDTPRESFDCDDAGAALFDPTPVLPWTHADPARESAAGDPKALILAALGGWLAEMTAGEQDPSNPYFRSSRREIGDTIYRLAWLLLFGVPRRADPARISGSLQKLLAAWCDEFLWKGPRCCGDPHGVVIGCALVDAGTIQAIDPFGGRRYVVHYPLLEHWGSQFGLAPLDSVAMRFFSRICCIASLPQVGGDGRDVPAELVHLGGGYLAMGTPKAIADRLAEEKVAVASQRKVGMPELIVTAIRLIGTKRAAGDQQYTALVPADFVADGTVMLLTPNA
jgi:hypothetical protein